MLPLKIVFFLLSTFVLPKVFNSSWDGARRRRYLAAVLDGQPSPRHLGQHSWRSGCRVRNVLGRVRFAPRKEEMSLNVTRTPQLHQLLLLPVVSYYRHTLVVVAE